LVLDIRKAKCSFLKKRTKKLLLFWAWGCFTSSVYVRRSFLLLFFKKEALSFPAGFTSAALFVDGLSDAAALAGQAEGDRMIGFGKIA